LIENIDPFNINGRYALISTNCTIFYQKLSKEKKQLEIFSQGKEALLSIPYDQFAPIISSYAGANGYALYYDFGKDVIAARNSSKYFEVCPKGQAAASKAVFSSSFQYLVCYESNNAITLLEIKSGEKLLDRAVIDSIPAHANPTSIFYDDAQNRLFIGYNDGFLRVYTLKPKIKPQEVYGPFLTDGKYKKRILIIGQFGKRKRIFFAAEKTLLTVKSAASVLSMGFEGAQDDASDFDVDFESSMVALSTFHHPLMILKWSESSMTLNDIKFARAMNVSGVRLKKDNEAIITEGCTGISRVSLTNMAQESLLSNRLRNTIEDCYFDMNEIEKSITVDRIQDQPQKYDVKKIMTEETLFQIQTENLWWLAKANIFLAIDTEKNIKITDAAGKIIRTISGNGSHIHAAAACTNGDSFATMQLGRETVIRVYEINTGNVRKYQLPPDIGRFYLYKSLLCNSEGVFFMFDNQAWFAGKNSDKMKLSLKLSSPFVQVKWNPQTGHALFYSADKAIEIYSPRANRHLGRLSFVTNSIILFTTPDGRFDYTDKRALEYVSYRVGEKFVDLQELHDYYYTPGLLKMVLKDTLPPNDVGNLDQKLRKLPNIKVFLPNDQDAQDKIAARKMNLSFTVNDTGGGVSKIAVRVKGKLVWESPAGAKLPELHNIPITLDGGANQVSVTAYNASGGPHTETVDLNCAEVDLKKQSRLFVLSVGISEYKQNALTYAANDAKAVIENVTKQSKSFFKEVVTIPLYDKDATLGRIQKEIRKIKEQATEDDVVMLYFSGHGLSVKEESGKKLFAFIPQDYPWRGDEVTSLRRFGLTHDYLAGQVKEMKPTKIVIIMDACHSGDAQLAFAKSAENSDREILEKLANGTGVFMLTSSAGKQISREDPSIGHGIFTYVLLEGLKDKSADTDGNGAVSIKELTAYVDSRFESRAQKIMGKNFVQTPVVRSYGRNEASAAALDFPLASVR